MGRNLAPKGKRARRLGFAISDKTAKIIARRPAAPGMHGANSQKRLTTYGQQLREKQKAKFYYGMLEKQFRNMFEKSKQQKGDTTENLVSLLETRLDTMVANAQLAPTQSAARQLVTHGHITVNGRVTDIPSYTVRMGDVISIRKESREKKNVKAAFEKFDASKLPSWVNVNKEEMTVQLTGKPPYEEANRGIDYRSIIEFYSR